MARCRSRHDDGRWWRGLALGGALALAACAEEEPAPSPTESGRMQAAEDPRANVLMIVWDTVRADRLTPYDPDRPTTPRLQEFAREGRVYEHCVSPGIWTIPSHASLFTGQPVRAHGTRVSYKWLEPRFTTAAEWLAESGYATYAFSANPYVSELTNLTRGFSRIEHPWSDEWSARVQELTEAKITAGDRSVRRPDLGKDAGIVARDALLGWLDEKPEDTPFFAFLNLMEAHDPRMPSEEARRKLLTPAQQQAARKLHQGRPRLLGYMLGVEEIPAEDLDLIRALYDACLYDLDRATAAVLDALEERGLLDQTLVIFTSDHGENLGDHRLFSHKFSIHESLIHVPLILHWPERITPGREPRTISNRNVFATILDAAGLDLPEPEFSSSLLRPLDPARMPEAISELVEPTVQAFEVARKRDADFDPTPWRTTYQAVERDRKKLVVPSVGPPRLYDLSVDPGESRDRAGEEPELVQVLWAVLERFLEQYPVHEPVGEVGQSLSPEMIRRLQNLGYSVEDDG